MGLSAAVCRRHPHSFAPADLAGPSFSWQTTGNWTVLGDSSHSSPVPNLLDDAALLTAPILVPATVQLASPVTLGSLTIDSTNSNGYTISPNGGNFTFDVSSGNATISASGVAANVISAGLTLNDSTDISNTSTGALTISGAIAGSKALFKSGSGTLILTKSCATARNTATATTQINGGVLRLQDAKVLNNGAGTAAITINAGTLELAAGIAPDQAISMYDGAVLRSDGINSTKRAIAVTALAHISLATVSEADLFRVGSSSYKLTGGGTGTLVDIAGPGTVRLGGSGNPLVAQWHVSSGSLELGVADTLASGSQINLDGGRLIGRFYAGSNIRAAVVVQSSSRILAGYAVGDVQDLNYPFSSLQILGGQLTVENDKPSGGAPVVSFSSTDIAVDAALNIVNGPSASTTLLPGALSGNKNLTKKGDGLLRFNSPANGFSGGITVAQGAVETAATDALGSGNVTIAGGASLLSTVADSLGSGRVSVAAGGQLAGNTPNAFRSSASGNPPLPIDLQGGTLLLTTPISTVFGGDVSVFSNSSLTIDGTGSITALSHVVDNLTLNDARLSISAANCPAVPFFSTRTATIASATTGAILDISGAQLALGAMAGSGKLIKTGSGELILANRPIDFAGPFENQAGLTTIKGADHVLNGPISITGGMMRVELPYAQGDGAITLSPGTGLTFAGARGTTTTVSNAIAVGDLGEIHSESLAIGSSKHLLRLNGPLTITGTARLFGTNTSDIDLRPSSLDLIAGSSLTLTTGRATLSLSSSPNLAANTAINILSPASLTISGTSDPCTDARISTQHLAIANDGSLTMLATHLQPEFVSGTGSITLGDGANAASSTTRYVQAGALSIYNKAVMSIQATSPLDVTEIASIAFGGTATACQGQLDLGDSSIIIRPTGSPDTVLTSIIKQVRCGQTGGASPWTGQGIVSSLAAANPLRGIAVLQNIDAKGQPRLPTWRDRSIDARSILVVSVWSGDADMNGTVDADDYHRIDMGLLSGATGYSNGDFNLDGSINVDDYWLIDRYFMSRVSNAPTHVAMAAAVVPEPSLLALFSAMALLSLRCRPRTAVILSYPLQKQENWLD